MNPTQKIILAFLSITACVLVGLVGYYVVDAYQFYATQPLGPALPESTYSLPPTWTPTTGANPIGAVTLVPTLSFPTGTPSVKCGGPGVMTLLAVGSDARSDSYQYGLADVIRLVRVDFVTPRLTVLEFPRDLWVEIPEISDNLDGQDHEKLNQAYLYGNPGDGFHYWDEPSAGPGLLALTLSLNFGVEADHYVAVNMRTFEKIVDAVDGIDLNVTDEDMADATGLKEGNHHLNGPQALKVARRRDEGVFARASNQNLVLCALRDKIVSPRTVGKIPDLIASFQDNIQTDLTPEQLGQLACIGTQLPIENITFASFPEELFQSGRVYDPVFEKRVFIWETDFNVLRDYVARFQAGTWPARSIFAAEEGTSTTFCP